ncbi:MAG: hypothetical protein JNL81_14015 [Hyphomonadaceae bacterium]|nr:hypothetical protein [Hyphomonadaceae bacterium]
MAGVVFIFVREDASDVEALAEAFDRAGYRITGSDGDDAALHVVVWSRAAMLCAAFRAAAARVLRSPRAVVASLVTAPYPDLAQGAVVADISAWDGIDEAGLAPLLEAVLDVVHPVRANVIALPGPVYTDAEFTEAPLQLTHVVSVPRNRARAAWETPIPAGVPRPVQADAVQAAKIGAPSPRRDFRRLKRLHYNRAHAALAFALLALVGGTAVVLSAPSGVVAPAPRAEVELRRDGQGVSLASATAEAVGLDDSVPEAPAQIGRRGVEPPSARTVRRARYEP